MDYINQGPVMNLKIIYISASLKKLNSGQLRDGLWL